MAETLTKVEISQLAAVGAQMCTDMIDATKTADVFALMGMEDSNPARRVTCQTTDTWVSIVTEYGQALDELTANGTL